MERKMKMTLTDAAELGNHEYETAMAGRVYLAEKDNKILIVQSDSHAVLLELDAETCEPIPVNA